MINCHMQVLAKKFGELDHEKITYPNTYCFSNSFKVILLGMCTLAYKG